MARLILGLIEQGLMSHQTHLILGTCFYSIWWVYI